VIRAWLELSRVSNLPTVWTNVLVAWLLAGGGWQWQPLGWLLLGGSLLYTGGMILNDAADVAFDRANRPERPIPSGRIRAITAWLIGLGMMALGYAAFIWGAEACTWLTGCLVVAILAYDLYHKPWAGSVFVMGSCRTLLYLSAASAVTGTLNWNEYHEVIVKAIALGAYIVGLSLCARNESAAAPAAPSGRRRFTFTGAVGIFGLFLPVVAGVWYGGWYQSWLVIPFAVILGLLILLALRWMKLGGPHIGRAVGLLLASIPLVDGVAVATVSLPAALVCLALVQPLRLWQRKIAAT